MRRKLVLLNLALLALALATAWELRVRWVEGKDQERKALQPNVKAAEAIAPALPRGPQPASAAAYSEVAQKMLFSRDRNPDVAVDVAPPKPVPPFPVAYGVMDLGSGPIAMLSLRAGAPGRQYSAGDKVGEFTLVALNNEELLLEWEGQRFLKKVSELKSETAKQPAAAEAATPAATPAGSSVSAGSAPTSGPGLQLTDEVKACVQGDATPAGTVRDGYRKVVSPTPFGVACRWELVK
jgi:hypothetical protein